MLTHLLAEIDHPGLRERIVQEIQETYQGRVIWGEDLMSLSLGEDGTLSIETLDPLVASPPPPHPHQAH